MIRTGYLDFNREEMFNWNVWIKSSKKTFVFSYRKRNQIQ